MSSAEIGEEKKKVPSPPPKTPPPKSTASDSEPPPGRVTSKLVLCIVGACLGNAFLYGWQIGVTNQPAEFIKGNFRRVLYERKGGGNAKYMDIWNFIQWNDRDGCVARAGELYNDEAQESKSLDELKKACEKYTNSDQDVSNEDKIDTAVTATSIGLDSVKLPQEEVILVLFSLTTSIFVIGGFIGGFASSYVVDKFGRRTGMLLISPLILIASGLATPRYIPELLIVSRFIGGLHSGLCVSMNSLYLTEIAPTAIRGAVGVIFQLFITIGILMTQIVGLPILLGTPQLYPYIFTAMVLPAVASDLILMLCPESPSYMLSNRGDERAALKGLQFLRGAMDGKREMDKLIEDKNKSKEEEQIKSYTLCELLAAKELRLAVVIACVLMIAQQLSGVNAVFAYSTVMYKQVGISVKQIPYMVVLTGVVNVLMTVVAVPLMDKLGRRILLIFPTMLAGFAFVIMTIMLFIMNSQEDKAAKTTYGYICVVCIMLFIIGFAVGLGPIPFLVIGEIFRQEPRAAAMSLALLFNWSCNFLVQMCYPIMDEKMGAGANIPFSLVLVGAVAFFIIYIPETKGKSIEEITIMLTGKKAEEDNQTAETNKPEPNKEMDGGSKTGSEDNDNQQDQKPTPSETTKRSSMRSSVAPQ